MFSLHQLTDDSYPVAVIVKNSTKKVVETVFFTEPTRKFKTQPIPFEEQIQDYLDDDPEVEIEDMLTLDGKFSFEMVPTCNGTVTMPRFVNYYIAPSNSGKSFQIAALCRRYLQAFNENSIAYASANDITKDINYEKIRDKVKIVDVINLNSIIKFDEDAYHNTMFIWDDCDSGFSVGFEDLDPTLGPEEAAKLSITEKNKNVRILKRQTENASLWVKKSIESFLANGRKFNESLCIVGHKPFSGTFENIIVLEATGVVVFPASIEGRLLSRFISNKLGYEPEHVDEMLNDLEWFRYDWLFLSHRTTKKFMITQNNIKLFPKVFSRKK